MTHSQRKQTPEEDFGETVRFVRTARGWSQEAMARRLREEASIDIDQSGIARIESGKRALRLNDVHAICELLKIELHFGSGTPELRPEDLKHDLERTANAMMQVESEFAEEEMRRDKLRNELEKAEARLQELHMRRAEITAHYRQTERRYMWRERPDGDR